MTTQSTLPQIIKTKFKTKTEAIKNTQEVANQTEAGGEADGITITNPNVKFVKGLDTLQ